MKIEINKNERIDDLEFKGLKIIQNKKGFCFGIDAVILSDFAKNIKSRSIVADLGAGTGILSILLCGKTNLEKVYAIEVQKEVSEMAERSVRLNNLEDRIKVININIKDMIGKIGKNSVDVVITNPPYKKENTGITNIKEKQNISRHEVLANLEDFIEQSSYILKQYGEFYMVHRPERLSEIISVMKKYKIEPKELRLVCSKINRSPKLILIKGVKNGREYINIRENLVIYNEDGSYTDEIYEIYNKEKREK